MSIFSPKAVGIGSLGVFMCALGTHANAQSLGFAPSMNMFGTTGLIDMPTAESQPDAELNVTIAGFAGATKGSFTFQITPRATGTFRYAKIPNWTDGGTRYDRSFDFQFRLLDEAKYRPAVAVGLRDFMGTGIFSGQYVVATKNLGDTIKVSAGLGWGRFSDSDETQSNEPGDFGGKPLFDQWFQGPVGVFGGVEWQTPIQNLRLKMEYSSDQYIRENEITGARTQANFDLKSQLNFGAEYQTKWGATLGLYYMYGSEIGFSLSTALNPNRGRGVVDRAPRPIALRDRPINADTSWTNIEGISGKAREQLDEVMNRDGLSVEGLAFTGTRAEVRFRNSKYIATSQAVGRTARAMARVFPDSVEEFVIVPMNKGLATASFTIQRSDLERFENHPNAARMMVGRVDIDDAGMLPKGAKPVEGLYPKFSWSLAPYASVRIFNSDNLLEANGGFRLAASYVAAPGLTFSGSITKNIAHSDDFDEPGPSGLERVRTNASRYYAEGDPALERLTADYVFKLRPDVYGRVTAGMLENMFGGVSTEVLWKPADSNWGLGLEINYVKQRDFDRRLGFQDYSVVTGHASAYVELAKGYQMQLDVGRYLAGDNGATLSVRRTFGNGWKVGAYATITDVSSADFGEGSFDKGISLEIPLGWITGKPTKKTVRNTLASLTRDGGARLSVNNRLYGLVQDDHRSAVSANWPTFWE